jgi:hypothetical protein
VLEVLRVPEDDGGDQQIEAGRPEKLVFESAVAQFAEAVEEDGARKGVAGFPFVKAGCPRPRCR